jgi:predicted metalloendopeptidase
MDTIWIVAIIAIAALILGAVAVWYMGNARKNKIRGQFGEEYDRAVMRHDGKEGEASRELAERQKRVEKYRLRELEPAQRERFSDEWRSVQTRFVDSPDGAINEADHLVQQVMDARGYPVKDFDQQAEDISVEHPDLVTNYRRAHAIAEANDDGKASTEDMRQAFIYYRSLFAELLGSSNARAGAGGRA